ncbi:hypothetical protein [Legionella tunisiensis]|uniref:hypothetical protein n=1 Tax=Legionella tunisiensis TaxID=1034944 RepID=UPI0002E463B5|nr:hypothetical protein [Legionella tunisiensis]
MLPYIDLLKIFGILFMTLKQMLLKNREIFHKEYEQCINGVSMNRTEYIQHVLAQRQMVTIDTIDYKHVLEQGNELFAIYYPIGRNKKGLPLEAEVIAYFHFENQQLYRIHGQVRLIKGDLTDVDMENS